MKTVSSREFNNDVAVAKRAAAIEPVIITDRGEPAFVLLSVKRFRELTGSRQSALEVLLELGSQFAHGELDFEWEPRRVGGRVAPARFDI